MVDMPPELNRKIRSQKLYFTVGTVYDRHYSRKPYSKNHE
jgi:hypothetical protein